MKWVLPWPIHIFNFVRAQLFFYHPRAISITLTPKK